MSETLTIRERIERRIAGLLHAVADVVTVHRALWTEDTLEHRHAYVWAMTEQPAAESIGAEAQGNPPQVTVIAQVFVAVCIVISEDDRAAGDTPATVHNRWVGRLVTAFMADPDLTDDDANTEPLSNAGAGVRVTNVDEAPEVGEQGEIIVGITLSVPYQHAEDDPTIGAGITARTG